jgi:hypothetical protein
VDRGGFGVWRQDERQIAAEYRYLTDAGAIPYDESIALALEYILREFDDPAVNARLYLTWKAWTPPPAADTEDQATDHKASLQAYTEKYREYADIILEGNRNGDNRRRVSQTDPGS